MVMEFNFLKMHDSEYILIKYFILYLTNLLKITKIYDK